VTSWFTPAGLHTAASVLPVEGELSSFGGATRWYNSPPLTPADLRGKVVLVDFWTYTCINWLRTLPYVRAWEAFDNHYWPALYLADAQGRIRHPTSAKANISRRKWSSSSC
jgi:hypothetical protein